MLDFKYISETVSIKAVAQLYGLKLNHSDMCNCPMHGERTASLKIYEKNNNFHCFGCGEHGDVIDLTAKLNGLSTYEAAQLLDRDLGLGLSNKTNDENKKISSAVAERKKLKADSEKEEKWLNDAFIVVNSYNKILAKWQNVLRPARDSPGMNPLFVEALSKQSLVDDLLDRLTKSNTRHDVYLNSQHEVKQIAERLRKIIQDGLHKSVPTREHSEPEQQHQQNIPAKGMKHYAR